MINTDHLVLKQTQEAEELKSDEENWWLTERRDTHQVNEAFPVHVHRF